MTVVAAGCGSGLRNLPASVPREHHIAGIPFHTQGRLECAVACVEMVLEYYGRQHESRDALKAELGFDPVRGTPRSNILRVFRESGFTVKEGILTSGNMGDIVHAVSRGRPVIVRQWPSAKERKRGWAGHYMVVAGYNLTEGNVTLLDPARKNGKPRILPVRQFLRMWDMLAHPVPSFNWMAVPYPDQG